jgi:hypothetical protein
MTSDQPTEESIELRIVIARDELPILAEEARALLELAKNAERAAVSPDPRTLQRARDLLATIAGWQGQVQGWQAQESSEGLSENLRVLKISLDAASTDADSSTSGYRLNE